MRETATKREKENILPNIKQKLPTTEPSLTAGEKNCKTAQTRKPKKPMDQLMKMAREYSVDKNALFLTALAQYKVQQNVIEMINDSLSQENEVTVVKEYVKGRENSYINPAAKELPKHADSANKTAVLLLEIITKLGIKKIPDTEIDEIRNS